MRYTSDEQRRYAFRDWLQEDLKRLDFYQRRGERYLVSEFARYAKQQGARVEEVSLGRYLREKDPVLPTPESCRELARALARHPVEVLMEAGYLIPEDFFFSPTDALTTEELRQHQRAIDQYTLLPDAIRQQMKAALEHQPHQRTDTTPTLPTDEPTLEEGLPDESLPDEGAAPDDPAARRQPTGASVPLRHTTDR